MKVLVKIPLTLGILIVFYGAAVLAVAILFIQPSFARMEMRWASSNLDRLVAALTREGQHLANLDRDWSAWDDTYEFIDHGKPGYLEDNFSADSWKQTQVDLMALYAEDGTLRFEGSFDASSGTVVPETLFPSKAPRGSPYLQVPARPRDLSGFVDSPRGVYLVASTPILPTSGFGAVRGTFIMARLIDQDLARELSDQTSVAADMVRVLSVPPREMEPVLAADGKLLEVSPTRKEILGFRVVRDLWGVPALLVRSHTPREITSGAAATIRVSMIMILALAVAFVATQYLQLHHGVVRPLRILEEQVRRREQDEEWTEELSSLADRRDELGSLAGAFRHLGESLAERGRELKAYNLRLESRVAERTDDLRAVNQDLRILAKVVESTADSVVVTDLSGTILRVNQSFCRTSGYAESELLGKNPRLMKSGRHDAEFYCRFWERLTREGTWQGEIWDRRQDGAEFPRWLTVNLVRDEQGSPSGYVGVSTDISKLLDAEERLRRMNRLYRATSRTSQLIVHEKDRARLVREICRIAVEDGGVQMAWVGFMDAATRAVVPAAWYGMEDGYLQAIRVTADDSPAGAGPTGTAIRENRHVFITDIEEASAMSPWRSEALARGYRSSAAFPLTEKGVPVGAFMTYADRAGFFDEQSLSLLDELAMDISYAIENIALQEERARLQEQVQRTQKMEAVGRLAGGVAHDFNNILTVINGYCQMGISEAAGETERRFFREIHEAGRRAAGLTSQLLAFGRRQVFRPHALDLGELVGGMTEMIRRLIGEDIEVRVSRAAGLWPALGDPGQVEQVIMNLVVNSRDAMPRGGRLEIETANERVSRGAPRDGLEVPPGDYVRLSVRDNGSGMDAQTLAHMYDPYFTTKEAGKGTGLGLATVYGIVSQSGGTIACQSAVGRGTTFHVYLPRSAETRTGPAAVAQAQAPATRGHGSVLFVDDDDAVRRLAVSILVSAGYRVISAGSGAEALAAAHEGPAPDLLVTDVVMPGMDGIELARQLSARYDGLRALYVSGYAEDAIHRHGVPAGSIEVLRKPFTPADFLEAVRAAMTRQ